MTVTLNYPRAPRDADPVGAGSLCRWVRYTAEGAEPVSQPGDELLPGENLIVKGENLAALRALRPIFEGRVQLIYIDPPYNTGNGRFRYHDSFQREEWLPFMEARLSAARPLLAPTGALCIQIGHREMAYLKVLCDQVLGEENYVGTVTVRTATTASFRSVNDCPVNVSEYILIYAGEKKRLRVTPVYVEAEYSEDYGSYIEGFEGPTENWEIVSVNRKLYQTLGLKNWKAFRDRYGADWKQTRLRMKAAFCREHRERVVSLNTVQKPSRKLGELLERSRRERGRIFVYRQDGENPLYFYNGRSLAFYSKKFRPVDGGEAPATVLTNLWEDISFLSLGTEGGVELSNGKKPERLIRRLIQLFAGERTDLVLDFFLGCGTTCAVAHKMGRPYVGVELLDYGPDDCVVRLRNVLGGEQSGISREEAWTGGGSFLCCGLE